MIRRFLAVLAAASFATTTAAAAQATVNTSSVRTNLGGVAAGGYIGSATVGSDVFTIFCTDKNNNITLGSSFQAYLTPLFGTIDLSRTRLGALTPFALDIYTANASLASLIATPVDAADQTRQNQIWLNAELPNRNAAPLYGNTGFDATGWYVVTQVGAAGNDDRGVQELLAFQPSVVPEPSTYALMATGLIGMAGIARRRRTATV